MELKSGPGGLCCEFTVNGEVLFQAIHGGERWEGFAKKRGIA